MFSLAESDVLVAHMKIAFALDREEDLQSLVPVESGPPRITFKRNWSDRKRKRRLQFEKISPLGVHKMINCKVFKPNCL